MTEDNQGYILVVDDNEMNRDMLSRRLQRQKYNVVVAEDGVRALEMMEEADFDLVLLDIMMPRLNGYQVLEKVKSNSKLRHIPIIMISAVDDLDSVVKCIELGAEDYLFKPFNPVLLKARVRAGLDRKRANDELLQSGTAIPPQAREIIASIDAHIRQIIEGSAGMLTPNQKAALKEVLTDVEQLTMYLRT